MSAIEPSQTKVVNTKGVIALHLKSLTLKGFKSFAQPTTLEFGPGITCIVGPNGSGKSNIVDALAWVMGEQGAKTLRGGKMEDVIFAGTQQLGPLGRAEVKLTIDNSDGALPIEYSEVTVGRTLFRNGTSEYSINGENCRLLDVQELLSDSGLGREMHVIVGQGQLDTVLRSDPMEIRGFIEEAAGILKFRARKEKSQRKLEAMQNNLDRLSDLIAEIKRQLKPLARQAEVAQNARELQRSLRQSKIRYYGQQLAELGHKLGTAKQNDDELRAELAYLDQDLQTTRLAIAELEQQLLNATRGDSAKRLATLLAARNRITQLQLKLAESDSTDLVAEISLLQSRLEVVTGELATNQRESEAQGDQIANLNRTLQELEQQKSQVTGELRQLAVREQQVAREREQEQREAAERASARNLMASQLKQAELELAEAEARLEERAQELAVARVQHEQLQQQLSQEKSAELRRTLETAEAQLVAARNLQDSERAALHALEREQDALAAELATLNAALSKGVQIKQVRELNILGVNGWLAEAMSIAQGMERAVSAALGSLGEAILVDSIDTAIAAAKQLNRNSARVQFVVGRVMTEGQSFPGSLRRLTDFVTAPEGVAALLAGFAVADTLSEAVEILDSHPSLSVVTTEGQLLSASLVSAGGEQQQSQVELVARRDSCSKSLESLKNQLKAAKSSLDSAAAAFTEQESAVKTLVVNLRELDSEYAALAEQTGRAMARIESLEAQVAREAQVIAGLSERRDLLEVELEGAGTQEFEANLPPVDSLGDERSRLESALESIRTRELDYRITEGSLRERESLRASEMARMSSEITRLQAELSIARSRLADRGLRQSRLDAISASLPLLNSALDEMLETQQRQTSSAQESVERIRSKLDESRQKSGLQEIKSAAVRERVQNLEIAQHELRLNLSNLQDRTRIELGLEPEELTARGGELLPNESVQVAATDSHAAGVDKIQQEREIRSLEAKLSAIGQFNPLALEEHKSLSERHSYLVEQFEDLTRARSELRKIIDELDGSMLETFQSAFQDTAREFESLFPKLFPGGAGSLSLSDLDNPLSTGVAVNVRPAGKRIERMSLLSGGERSLAAVALLLSIFKARPSPFYVLDEVEAALDDANLGRLLEAINNLGESAQLIIVTHQKRTMEVARLLYGVSMAKSGVSAVVSSSLELAS
ncbi:MAG: chromosome segregation protein [Actinomycetota bacterium]